MVFITPNHPEFFTDWMLDKELAARYAPMMANWATHDIVNGMGRWGQKFWLANNLIAQVPGDTEQALAYSIDTAATGTPVLLHPEGSDNSDDDDVPDGVAVVPHLPAATVRILAPRMRQLRAARMLEAMKD